MNKEVERMLHTIQNSKLSITIADHGAEIQSILSSQGTEYLWQGDPAYWADRSPVLFPFIGRLTSGKYTMDGKEHSMSIHGIAPYTNFALVKKTHNCITLELQNSNENYSIYPRHFSFCVTYRLIEQTLTVTYTVKNNDQQTMYFGLGGHPGFNVPLHEGELFENYVVEFKHPCQPDRIGFSPSVFLNGHDERFPLRENKFLDLRHNLFDDDAIILKNMATEVSLYSKVSRKGITLSFSDFSYLGIWHWPKTDAPYVCLEPWTSLPSRQDVVEEFSCKSDLIRLKPGKAYEASWSLCLME